MTDPHVAALHYRINHAPTVDFDKAEPAKHDEPAFSVRLEDGRAKVVMKGHHTTIESARDVVEPFLRTWELSWALCHPADKFEFAFVSGDLIDRNPTPGAPSAQASLHGVGSLQVNTHHIRAKYPDPPHDLGWSAEVDLMFERYRRVCEQRTTLNDAVNFCLTAVELLGAGANPPKKRGPTKKGSGAPRDRAATLFQIDLDVLNMIGELAAEKGGETDARKLSGAYKPFTPAEREWLKKALKLLVRRTAEKAHCPSANRSLITMADLPPISRITLPGGALPEEEG